MGADVRHDGYDYPCWSDLLELNRKKPWGSLAKEAEKPMGRWTGTRAGAVTLLT